MKRSYRRYFVMLEVEDKAFGIVKNQVPKGYGKIEIKNDQGTLAINCQNLKAGNNVERYRWYLINTKKENEPLIVEVGPMEVDEKGKGDVIWEFNAENVRGSMEEIDNFDVLALVAKNKDNNQNLLIPLVGYMDKEKKTSWRYALEKYLYIPSVKEKVVEEVESVNEIDQEVQSIQDPPMVEEVEEQLYENVETDGEYIPIRDSIEEILDNKMEKSKTLLEENVVEEVEKEQPAKEEVKEENKKEDKILEEDPMNGEQSFKVQMQGYIENTLKDFYKVDPFINNLGEYIWWQIPYNHQTVYRSYMPFILYIDSVKGPINYYASKMLQTIHLHQHHIFGIQYDTKGEAKYYAYGIPGRKLPSDQPYEGATGFIYWHPCDPEPHDIHSHGYWILRIDPNTGGVIEEPQK